ncbi:hypothetical protein BC567DRAFT_232994 [Phyllosticta citribraziliensis]
MFIQVLSGLLIIFCFCSGRCSKSWRNDFTWALTAIPMPRTLEAHHWLSAQSKTALSCNIRPSTTWEIAVGLFSTSSSHLLQLFNSQGVFSNSFFLTPYSKVGTIQTSFYVCLTSCSTYGIACLVGGCLDTCVDSASATCTLHVVSEICFAVHFHRGEEKLLLLRKTRPLVA